MSKPLLSNAAAGDALFGIVKHLNQGKMNQFSLISGGQGAQHLDAEYARTSPYGTTIALGHMLTGYVEEMLKNNFGIPWMKSGFLDAKLIYPARAGETLVAGGTVTRVENQFVVSEVWLKNSEGRLLVVGEASFSNQD